MTYYHCSPTQGLKILLPGKPTVFQKPKAVYMTTLLPMALMYGIRNYEYTYGYTKEGQIYLDEYFPNALEILYKDKSASLYICNPQDTQTTRIPNEILSSREVPVLEEIRIPDVMEALLEQKRLGALLIHRYEELSEGQRNWIRRAEADSIRQMNLIGADSPEADYYRTHYPESWAMVISEKENSGRA